MSDKIVLAVASIFGVATWLIVALGCDFTILGPFKFHMVFEIICLFCLGFYAGKQQLNPTILPFSLGLLMPFALLRGFWVLYFAVTVAFGYDVGITELKEVKKRG